MKSRRLLYLIIVLLLVIFAAGCAPVEPADSDAAPIEPTGADPVLPVEPTPNEEEIIMPPATGRPFEGQVPEEMMDAIFAEIQETFSLDRSALTILRAEEVIWNDGSLGCPQPGVSYTQALVEGYWIVLEAGGVTYDYRASQTGYFIHCDGGGGLPIEPPTG